MNLPYIDHFYYLWSNLLVERDEMVRANQVKIDEQHSVDENFNQGNFTSESRLNLNDLLKRRQEEKKVEKKINLMIFSGAAVVGIVVLAILSL